MTVADPLPEAPRQAVILLDRESVADTRRPGDVPLSLVEIGGRPFLDYLIETCVRFGFDDLLLLSEVSACALYERFSAVASQARARVKMAVERRPAGAGDVAALRAVRQRLADRFLLLEGSSLFGFNWLDLMLAGTSPPVVAARRAGAERESLAGGVFLVARRFIEGAAPHDAFAPRVDASALAAVRRYNAFFIDIAVAEDLDRAATQLTAWRRRPAVFFDRDGTVNVEVGYAFRPDQLAFTPGAIAAIKRVNDSSRYAFLVTNQSGVARGYYTLADMDLFHATMQRRLRAAGAHFDDIRYCPHHPDGIVPEFTRESAWRKPEPGMFLDLLSSWPVIREASLAVGDMERDVQAAKAAQIAAVQYRGGDLDALIAQHIGG